MVQKHTVLIIKTDELNIEREEWEQQFESFRLGVLLEEARKKMGMTQEQLAQKCGTNKSYISRIENNSSDIRLSTLMKIKDFDGAKMCKMFAIKLLRGL